MSDGTRSLLIRFLGDADQLSRASKQAEGATDSLEKRVKAVGAAITAAYAGSKVISFAKDSVSAAMEDAKAQDILDRSIRNVTGATDAQVAAAERHIAVLEGTLAVSDDKLRPALERLVRSTKDVSEAERLLDVALDVSAGTGKDLQTVVEALGKAHDGNTGALGRLGIATKDAEGKTKSFADIVADLSQKFSGQAAGAADTAAGRMEALRIRFDNLKETVGTALLPVVEQLASVVGSVVGWFNELDPGLQRVISQLVVFGGIGYTAYKTVKNISEAVGGLTSLFSKMSTMSVVSLGAVGVALAAVAVAVAIFGDEEDDTRRSAEEFSGAVAKQTAALETNMEAKQGVMDAEERWRLSMDALSRAILDSLGEDKFGNVAERMQRALGSLGFTVHDTARVFALLRGENILPNWRNLLADVEGLTDAQREEMAVLLTGLHGFEEARVAINEYGAAAGWSATQVEQVKSAWALFVEANNTDSVDTIAETFLRAASGASDLTQGLVAQARAAAQANAGTSGGVAAYQEYLRLAEGLSDEQRHLALNLDAATAAQADQADAQRDTNEAARDWQRIGPDTSTAAFGQAVATSAAKTRDLAAAEAEANERAAAFVITAASMNEELRNVAAALDALIGRNLNMEQANQRLLEAQQGVNEAIYENVAAYGDAGRSLDINTEAGRANRDAVQETVEAIVAQGEAMIEMGKSQEEVTRTIEWNRGALIGQMVDLGMTREAAEEYVNQLGLTPENIATAVELANQEKAKADIADILERLGPLDDIREPVIQALIDQGKYNEALTMLKELERERRPPVRPVVYGRGVQYTYAGGTDFHPGGMALVGEEGPEIVWLPRGAAVSSSSATRGIMSGLAAGGLQSGQVAKYDVWPIPTTAPPADGGTGGADDEDTRMANRYEAGDLGLNEYRTYLNARLAAAEAAQGKYSAGWMNQWRLIQGLNRQEAQAAAERADAEKKAADDAIAHQDRVMRFLYDTQQISLEQYRAYLAGRLASLDANSDAAMDLSRSVYDLDAKLLADREAAEEAARKRREDAEREAVAELERIYEDAQRRTAFKQAAGAVDTAMSQLGIAGAKAYWYALDRKRTQEERDEATKEFEDAKIAAAEALFKRADAGANAAGLDDNTIPWARAVRAALLADISNAPVLADAINKLLEGVPAFAKGLAAGPINPTPGGRLVRAGDGGQREWVATDDDLAALMRGGVMVSLGPVYAGIGADGTTIGREALKVIADGLRRLARETK